MRRYDDPVEVRKGWVTGPGHHGEGPEQFLWRGRLWKVRAVLAHWVETGPWWQSSGVRAVIGSDDAPAALARRRRPARRARAVAGGGRPGAATDADSGRRRGAGVFDLSFDWADGRWQLVGCAD